MLNSLPTSLLRTWYLHYNKVVGTTPYYNQDVNDLVRECPSLLDVHDNIGQTIAFYWQSEFDFIDLMTPERLNVVDCHGLTPLDHLLSRRYTYVLTIKEFIKRGARINPIPDRDLLNLIEGYGSEIPTLLITSGLMDSNIYIRGFSLVAIIMNIRATAGIILLDYSANSRTKIDNQNIVEDLISNRRIDLFINRVLIDFGVEMTLTQLRYVTDHNFDTNITIDSLYSFIFHSL
jgi:hypothetical protein